MDTHALAVKEVTKIYKNGVHALKNVSFFVEQGDFFGLLGPNGAGKSTLIGILTSLVLKTSGKVSIFGYNTDNAFAEAKNCIGVVPQEFNFNIFEVLEDILIQQAGYYGIHRKIAKERAHESLHLLGLWDKRRATPRELSGGMKRRLMIARALVHHPRMLILDEPTAGVDIELRRTLWNFLQTLNQQGTTIILTTHYLEEAEQMCRNIAIIDEGEIIENTSTATLLQQLDRERLILYLKTPLKTSPTITGYRTWLLDELTLEVEIKRENGLHHLFHLLEDQGILVTSLRNKANRLEELFLKLTTTSDANEY